MLVELPTIWDSYPQFLKQQELTCRGILERSSPNLDPTDKVSTTPPTAQAGCVTCKVQNAMLGCMLVCDDMLYVYAMCMIKHDMFYV